MLCIILNPKISKTKKEVKLYKFTIFKVFPLKFFGVCCRTYPRFLISNDVIWGSQRIPCYILDLKVLLFYKEKANQKSSNAFIEDTAFFVDKFLKICPIFELTANHFFKYYLSCAVSIDVTEEYSSLIAFPSIVGFGREDSVNLCNFSPCF